MDEISEVLVNSRIEDIIEYYSINRLSAPLNMFYEQIKDKDLTQKLEIISRHEQYQIKLARKGK
jgi:H2-forming N5,N10-methylenetetrahydromethanopterin dehydrogenase-like enzyme